MFPFDQPPATAFYLCWYALTLVLHVWPMNYVLAGSTYLAILGVYETVRGTQPAQQPLADAVREWLPVALGIAITAGVAPLLFLQILYRREFYTANLLLFNRWMAILPVLIVAFYLLYLQKSHRLHERPVAVRAGLSVGILLAFAFVAWSWTENHLLSLQDQATWSAKYVGQSWFFFDRELIPRLSVWYFGSYPVLATVLGWQRWLVADVPDEQRRTEARTLAGLALSGLGLAGVAVVVYFLMLPSAVRTHILSGSGWTYAAVATLGVALQAAAWYRGWNRAPLCGRSLAAAAGGIVLSVPAATMLRELRRTAAIDLAGHAEAHAASSQIGGMPIFVLFLLVNAAVITALVAMIRRGLREAAAANPPRP
jgi:hypothetical protein